MKEKLLKELEKTIPRYETREACLLPALHLAQDLWGYISPEVEALVAEALTLPIIKVRQVTTFYTLFRDKPVGRYHLQVCRNLSCAMASGQRMLELLSQRLGVKEGETTPDGQFTLTTVECLGACANAPVIQINDRYVGDLTEAKLGEVLAEPQKWASE